MGIGKTTCVGEIVVGVTTIFAILHTSILFEPFGTNVTVKVWSAIFGYTFVIVAGGGAIDTVIGILAIAEQPFAPVNITEPTSLYDEQQNKTQSVFPPFVIKPIFALLHW